MPDGSGLSITSEAGVVAIAPGGASHARSPEKLRSHLADLVAPCNFGRGLKTLKGCCAL